MNRTKKTTFYPVLKKGLYCGIYAFTGMMLSGVNFTGNTKPFGLGFAGGTQNAYLLPSVIGAAAGYLLYGTVTEKIENISAVILVCFLRLGLENLFPGSKQKYLTTVCVLISGFTCSLIISVSDGFDIFTVLLCLCYAVTAAAASFFFSRMTSLLFSENRAVCGRPADCAAVFLSTGAVLLSFDRLTGGYISVPHIVSIFLILLLSYSRKTMTVFIAGISLGAVTGFSDGERELLFALPAAALLTGIAGEYGKAASAAAALIAELLSLVLFGQERSPLIYLCETLICVLIFVLIPSDRLNRTAGFLTPLSCETGNEDSRRALCFRLKTAAKAVSDIGASVCAVNDILRRAEIPEPDCIRYSVTEDMCAGCSKHDFCWVTCTELTKNAFTEANDIIKEKGRLTEDILPERLRTVCRCPAALCESFNRFLCEYHARLSVRNDLFETKELAAMQFVNAGDVLNDAAAGLYDGSDDDPVTAAAFSGVLEEFGFAAESVIASSDKRGKSTVSACCTTLPPKTDTAVLTDRLYEKTGIYYMPPSKEKFSDTSTVLNFRQSENLEVLSAVAVKSDPTEKYCGDTCETFFDGKGYFYVILSDGMGRGSRAALDSVMTASLTAKLMKAGLSMTCAVNAVNSALIVKSDKETLSTLDIMKLDMTTGTAEFFKAGASLSVIQTGSKTVVIERSSLPLGILKEVKFEHTETRLSPGDRVLIMSDGAAVLPQSMFRDILIKMRDRSVKDTAQAVADTAFSSVPSGKNDDITVACIEIKQMI